MDLKAIFAAAGQAQLGVILVLLFINIVTGVLSAIHRGVFNVHDLGSFMETKVVYVLGYIVMAAVSLAVPSYVPPGAVTGLSAAAVIGTFVAAIIKNVGELGLAPSPALSKIIHGPPGS